MNASNNFTVVGFICKDAEVRNFEKSSIARFGVSIKTTEKKGGGGDYLFFHPELRDLDQE